MNSGAWSRLTAKPLRPLTSPHGAPSRPFSSWTGCWTARLYHKVNTSFLHRFFFLLFFLGCSTWSFNISTPILFSPDSVEVMSLLSSSYSALLDGMSAEVQIRWLQVVVRNSFYPDLHRVRSFLHKHVSINIYIYIYIHHIESYISALQILHLSNFVNSCC